MYRRSAANKVFVRLIIGGQDGSVTFLVVAHNTSLEQLEESKAILRRLPSRKRQKRHYDEDNNIICTSNTMSLRYNI